MIDEKKDAESANFLDGFISNGSSWDNAHGSNPFGIIWGRMSWIREVACLILTTLTGCINKDLPIKLVLQ